MEAEHYDVDGQKVKWSGELLLEIEGLLGDGSVRVQSSLSSGQDNRQKSDEHSNRPENGRLKHMSACGKAVGSTQFRRYLSMWSQSAAEIRVSHQKLALL